MTNDLLVKIDTLIEMSKSTSNYDTIKAEKTEIEKEIEKKTRETEELRMSMQDEKYMKASDRIIDENIKVSLELKIKKLESNLRKLETEIKQKVEEESAKHDLVCLAKDKAERITKLIETLKSKLETINDEGTAEHYKKLLKTDEKKLETAKKEVSEGEEEYKSLSRELTSLTDKLEQIKNEIESENQKLKSTKENLSTNETYIDKERKTEDEERLQELEDKLTELETRRVEIENDPVVLGNEAKEFYIEEEYGKCMKKVSDLVSYIKTLPYMDIASSSNVSKILKDAEIKASAERDEFASVIESKKYNGSDTQIVEERQKYLESKKQELQDELDAATNRLRKMDNAKFQELNSLLSTSVAVQEKLEKDLVDYEHVIEQEKDISTPKKMNTLYAALQKKKEELKTVQEIILNYENEIEELMIESRKLEEETIKEIEEKIAKTEADIKEISKKVVMSSKANDILALESDKTKLKELNDTIKAIADRKKFSKTPSEIYDEIEMILGSPIEEPSEPAKEEPKQDTNDFRIVEDIELPMVQNIMEKEELPVEETFEVEMNKDDNDSPFPVLEPVDVPEMNSTSIEESIPKTKEETEKMKVVDIESIEEEQQKSSANEEDYIDFDAIIGGNNE